MQGDKYMYVYNRRYYVWDIIIQYMIYLLQ